MENKDFAGKQFKPSHNNAVYTFKKLTSVGANEVLLKRMFGLKKKMRDLKNYDRNYERMKEWRNW